MRARTLLLITGCAACGAAATSPPDAPPVVADARVVPPFPATIAFPARDAVFGASYDATLQGTAGPAVTRIDLTSNVGTLEIDGDTLTAFVFREFAATTRTEYLGFAIGPARWDEFSLACKDGALVEITDIGIAGRPRRVETASGTCATAPKVQAPTVALPALTIDAPTPVGGDTVTGPQISINYGGTGWLDLDGNLMPLIVYGRHVCQVCAPQTMVLYVVAWDATWPRAIAALVSLRGGVDDRVRIQYGRSLPDLAELIDTRDLAATWTTTLPTSAPALRP